jgi:hypothetical protein
LTAQQTGELESKNINGQHDRLLTLALPQSTKKQQVVIDKLLPRRKSEIKNVRTF